MREGKGREGERKGEGEIGVERERGEREGKREGDGVRAYLWWGIL